MTANVNPLSSIPLIDFVDTITSTTDGTVPKRIKDRFKITATAADVLQYIDNYPPMKRFIQAKGKTQLTFNRDLLLANKQNVINECLQ